MSPRVVPRMLGWRGRGAVLVAALALIGGEAAAQHTVVPLYGTKTEGIAFPDSPPEDRVEDRMAPDLSERSSPDEEGIEKVIVDGRPSLPSAASQPSLFGIVDRIRLPGIEPVDDRERVRDAHIVELPFGAVVHLRSQYASGATDGVGSGFLIDPGIVLTAAHVLMDPYKGPASRVIVTPACAANPRLVSPQRSVQPVDSARFRIPLEWQTSNYPVAFDYAAIFLPDAEAFRRCGALALKDVGDRTLTESLLNGIDQFLVVGFPAEKSYGTIWYGRGALSSFDTRVIRHLVDTTKGESGAPLIGIGVDPITNRNIPIAFGIHSRGDPATGAFNLARRIDSRILKDLERWRDQFGLRTQR